MLREIMAGFAKRTGLSPASNYPRRYLWTDAFAVCNYLQLYRQTGDEHFKLLSLKLLDQVHNQLGRHRQDDPRTGWISGLDENEGRRHPTIGGLRIGKKINERTPSDPFDEKLEWDRDGQYYHYLTKWMHALNCVSLVAAEPIYNTWARELAKTAHARFLFSSHAHDPKSIYWKMSIDLSRSLVPSMGHHDPLDGFIVYNQLQACATDNSQKSRQLDLCNEIIELAEICQGKNWVTNDPLGIGGLLCNAYQVAQMIAIGYFQRHDLLESLLESSLLGLDTYSGSSILKLPADYRLAFRELGLAIGLHAADRLSKLISKKKGVFRRRHTLYTHIDNLIRYQPLIERITTFWLKDSNREANTWRQHTDINIVMLATSLAPDGYLLGCKLTLRD